MQVLVEMKITVLDGDEKGREFTSKSVEETDTEFIGIGVLERVRLEWSHLHGMPTPVEVKEEKSCSECVHSGRTALEYPCNMCYDHSLYIEGKKNKENNNGQRV